MPSAAAGGLAVLAHFRAAPRATPTWSTLVDWGLGGLEVYYRPRSPDAATVEALAALAGARGLVATGGSDYHGDTMTYAEAH